MWPEGRQPGLLAMTVNQQAMSDSGSRMGVVTCREARSGAVVVAVSLPLSCRNFLQQLLHRLVRQVVVLDVVGSNPNAHLCLLPSVHPTKTAGKGAPPVRRPAPPPFGGPIAEPAGGRSCHPRPAGGSPWPEVAAPGPGHLRRRG